MPVTYHQDGAATIVDRVLFSKREKNDGHLSSRPCILAAVVLLPSSSHAIAFKRASSYSICHPHPHYRKIEMITAAAETARAAVIPPDNKKRNAEKDKLDVVE